MPKHQDLISSGELAKRLDMERWRLIHLIDRGLLPEPAVKMPGRRIYASQDVQRIEKALAANPQWRVNREKNSSAGAGK